MTDGTRNSRDASQDLNQQKMIKDVSRLWQYRNGLMPKDETGVPPVRPIPA